MKISESDGLTKKVTSQSGTVPDPKRKSVWPLSQANKPATKVEKYGLGMNLFAGNLQGRPNSYSYALFRRLISKTLSYLGDCFT